MNRLIRMVWALVLALLLVVGAEVARIGLGSHLHAVVPGRCYRCAQPSPEDLRMAARTLGIRSVVNLRGFDERPWYAEERDTTQRLGLAFRDAGFWASSQPTEEEFQQIVRAIDKSPEPVLIHCESGIDRSGLAAAIFLLLKTDASVERAAGQLSWRFGHNRHGGAGCHDRILASYGIWLTERGLVHSPGLFRSWTRERYRKENL
jgi:protein tyrosine phosphatase (PTP) superfamily phosphohydrolase (DUF442 family)